MLYTDDEITEYEYEIVDNAEWQDDNTKSEITMCDVCKELTQNKDTVKIHELYENTSGYFYPENEMIIKYCPCCGKELNAERKCQNLWKANSSLI